MLMKLFKEIITKTHIKKTLSSFYFFILLLNIRIGVLHCLRNSCYIKYILNHRYNLKLI